MEKKIAGLLGAVAALAALNTAQTAAAPLTSEILQANSYADLLEPIPNASALLRAVDDQSPERSADATVQLAQFYHHHHHHHHHHHGYSRRYRRHYRN